jgi:hypothetical protein
MSKRKRYGVIIRLESRLICRQVGEAAGEVKVNPLPIKKKLTKYCYIEKKTIKIKHHLLLPFRSHFRNIRSHPVFKGPILFKNKKSQTNRSVVK